MQIKQFYSVVVVFILFYFYFFSIALIKDQFVLACERY